MGAADTLVVASRGEGFSLVILEALATGLPVFTTDVGGSEAVSPDAGVVCDSVDRVVAAATSSTLPDRPTAERACLARSIHAEWSVGSAADDFVAIFESARVHAVREAPHVRARVGVRRPVVSTGAGVVSGTREHDRLTLAERD
jgi:glycosyltransferase involved in cell wall biosynthesis